MFVYMIEDVSMKMERKLLIYGPRRLGEVAHGPEGLGVR